jgi:hypothetical protein
MPLGRSPARTGPDAPYAPQADGRHHACLLQRRDPKQRFFSASQLLIIERCDDRLNPPGRPAALRVFAWGPLGAADRAIVLGGRGVQDDRDVGVPGSRHDRPVVERHELALAELFSQVLVLCAQAGLVRPEVVAIDGTKMAGNASRESTRDFSEIAREIIAEAIAIDEAEDELYGDQRGDELPEELRTREGRAEFFGRVREQQTGDQARDEPELLPEPAGEPGIEFDVQRIVARHQGREGWTREGRRQLEQRRWEHGDPVPRSREDRLLFAAKRLEEQRDAKLAANRAYEDYRATGRATDGRRLGKRPNPWTAPEMPDDVVSVSDPDSQRMKANLGYVQGYNAQAVVDEGQLVIGAEITNTPGDFSNLDPMITAAISELEAVAVTERPRVALADAGYWNEQHFDEVIANKHIQVLIPPDRGGRSEPRPGWTGGRYSWMRTVLDSPSGKALYRKRIQMIEPVFAHTKYNRLITRFHRRGRVAVRTEWRLLMATHNLTKLHRHQRATVGV